MSNAINARSEITASFHAWANGTAACVVCMLTITFQIIRPPIPCFNSWNSDCHYAAVSNTPGIFNANRVFNYAWFLTTKWTYFYFFGVHIKFFLGDRQLLNNVRVTEAVAPLSIAHVYYLLRHNRVPCGSICRYTHLHLKSKLRQPDQFSASAKCRVFLYRHP